MIARIARLLLVGTLFALGACSSFDRRWKEAGESGAWNVPAWNHQSTRWDGKWTSEKHHTLDGRPEGGRLRCVLAEVDVVTHCFPMGGPRIKSSIQRSLAADFHANWLLFSSDYTMLLTPVKNGSSTPTDFCGTHDLPKIFGGTYRYTAHIAGDKFTARYDSSYDHGTFSLTRVRP